MHSCHSITARQYWPPVNNPVHQLKAYLFVYSGISNSGVKCPVQRAVLLSLAVRGEPGNEAKLDHICKVCVLICMYM